MTENIRETLALLTAVTGLDVCHIPQKSGTDPTVCSQLLQYINDGLDERVQVVLCGTGLCYIIAPTQTGTVISAPIFCSDRADCPEAFVCSHTGLTPLIILRPGKISSIVRLLSTLLAIPQDASIATCQAELSDCIRSAKPLMAQSLIHDIPTRILMRNGNDFTKNKNDCFRFMLMLCELADRHAIRLKDWTAKQTQAFAASASVGGLVSCLQGFGESFMSAAFPALERKHSQIIQKACNIIHGSYNRHITQSAVANAVFVSPSYFSKIFNEALGCSFNQYLNLVRITKAKELLQNPLIESDAVAQMVGYENRSYFGKVFRTLTGTTPQRFRDETLHKNITTR